MPTSQKRPLNVFEDLRRAVNRVFDKVDRIGSLLALFMAFGVLLLSMAAFFDWPWRRYLAIAGLAFSLLNFALTALATTNARRQARRLLDDRRFSQDLGSLLSSMTMLTISLQKLSLTLFRMMEANSDTILRNIEALSFIPGVKQIGQMGPEQVKRVSSLLVEVTLGWNHVFEGIQAEMTTVEGHDFQRHRAIVRTLSAILGPVNATFVELEGEVARLAKEPEPKLREQHVERILALLFELKATLETLARSSDSGSRGRGELEASYIGA